MQLDDTLIALADDTRRRILRRLASGEARVTEVAEPFDISLNSVSKHIRLLERAGLVRRRVSGREGPPGRERVPRPGGASAARCLGPPGVGSLAADGRAARALRHRRRDALSKVAD